MPLTEFLLVEHHGAKDPRRQHELEIAFLKSHAAKISHAKRRQKRQQALFDAQEERAQHRRRTRNNTWELTLVLPPPQTLLGQGKLDPFGSVQSSELPPIMIDCMEYVYEVLWPINSPGLQGAQLRSVIQSWRRAGAESPLEFHAQISNAASLCLAESNDPATTRTLSMLRIVHQSKAIQLIQEAVNSLDGPPSVALITCILNMFVQGNQIIEGGPEPDNPEPLLFQAFNIRKYGRFVITKEHFVALIALVSQVGGLEPLPPKLANPLQLADLAGATQTLGHPIFPVLQSLSEIAESHRPDFDLKARTFLEHLGRGFNFRDDAMKDHTVALSKLLEQACLLTAATDQYERNSDTKSPLHKLAVRSIVFQHGMMSLPVSAEMRTDDEQPAPEIRPGVLEKEDEEDNRYEITRLTTLIYSDLVFFPTPAIWQVRQRLAAMLKERLSLRPRGPSAGGTTTTTDARSAVDEDSNDNNVDDYDDLLLWTIVLGGVAASNTANREWYVAQTHSQITRRRLSWDDLHAILRSFLYWDYVLEAPVTQLWVEAFASQGPGGLNLARFVSASEDDAAVAARATATAAAAAEVAVTDPKPTTTTITTTDEAQSSGTRDDQQSVVPNPNEEKSRGPTDPEVVVRGSR